MNRNPNGTVNNNSPVANRRDVHVHIQHENSPPTPPKSNATISTVNPPSSSDNPTGNTTLSKSMKDSFRRNFNTIITQNIPGKKEKQEDEPEQIPLDAICAQLKDPNYGVYVGEQSWVGMKFQNVFKGLDAVEWLMSNLDITRKEAHKIGKKLIKRKLITHMSSNLIPFTEACFYQFL